MAGTTPNKQDALRDLTDAELTTLAAGHTPLGSMAFGELVRRHQGKIRALLLRLTRGNRTLCDDLTQETFLRAYRGLSGFEGRARFTTWVHRIAYFVYLNHRNRVRQPAALPDEFELTTPAPEDELSANRADLRRDLGLLVGGLPASYREVVVMHFMRHVPYRDIAEALDMPLGTVKTQLHRAKLMMREQLVSLGDAPAHQAAA
ncbi:RNA polymerase sigma factor [Paraliomyxa miuraensis]|uniref:RNA polymerase sigma factor n=1 Tax=Paraliomyxa miuraensis TaxID=376150 RepID=UPI002257B5F0|nr:RNA polymerase sigma factor [Paraliomyxa miuraensis]MCX4243806.1 RNA polymerase sigma factor [Paraliomyxa miuraensis]